MTSHSLTENIELLSNSNPEAAIHLAYIECTRSSFCKAKNGELNLKISPAKYYHSSQNPSQEAMEWFSKLDLQGKQVLYVFGVGLGYAYDAAKKWLKGSAKRALVFLEDDPEVIHRLLETDRGYKILKDSQVHLRYFNELTGESGPFNGLYWQFLHKQIAISALPYYAKYRSDLLDQLYHKIFYESAYLNETVDEYLNSSARFYHNFYLNMRELADSYHGNALFDKFQGIPAIICGAGPSLKKNLKVLKTLKDKALIFAGGSSLNALTSNQLVPHFGAGIDPNPTQYDRIMGSREFPVPFFYRNRMYPEAFREVKGPKLYINGAGGYHTAEWIEKKLGIERELIDEGHNVVNFCAEIALALGCNPIIFVGMDLAFTGMQAYAPGVVASAQIKEQEIAKKKKFEESALKRKNIYGKTVYTLWKWVNESEWISNFAKKHPEVTVLNATEGGIGFAGVPNKKLAEVADDYLSGSYDLEKKIHKEIQKATFSNVTKEKVDQVLSDLAESLKRCIVYLSQLQEELESVRKGRVSFVEGEDIFSSWHTGKAALFEAELGNEAAYLAVLDVFNSVYQLTLQGELLGLTPQNRTAKTLEMLAKKYAFLRRTAEVNLYLLEKSQS